MSPMALLALAFVLACLLGLIGNTKPTSLLALGLAFLLASAASDQIALGRLPSALALDM